MIMADVERRIYHIHVMKSGEKKRQKEKLISYCFFPGTKPFAPLLEVKEKGLRKIQIITSDDLVSFSKVAPLLFTVVCAENMLKLFISQRSKKERVEKKGNFRVQQQNHQRTEDCLKSPLDSGKYL